MTTPVPQWVKDAPQTPLHEAIHGPQYHHNLLCSASSKSPLGSPGCVCLKLLRKADHV